jgi:hypothetical protein
MLIPAIDKRPTAASTPLTAVAFISSEHCAPVFGPRELNGLNSPVAQGSLRRMQHLGDRKEIAVRANLTIKYEFILRSDLPEFACRADCITCLLDTNDRAPRRLSNKHDCLCAALRKLLIKRCFMAARGASARRRPASLSEPCRQRTSKRPKSSSVSSGSADS